MPSLIRLLVLNNNPLLYATLRKLCITASDLELVGEVTDVARLAERCRIVQPHVLVVIDGARPFVFDILALIQQVAPTTKVFVILSSADGFHASALRTTQIAGCIFAHEIPAALVYLVRTVAGGGRVFSGGVMQALLLPLPDASPQPASEAGNESKLPVAPLHLTGREQEVLQLLAQGFSNKAIAQTLTISEKTVEFHLKNLFDKLNVTSRMAAVLAAKAYHLTSDH